MIPTPQQAPNPMVKNGPVSRVGDAPRGQQLYESRCSGCHSIDDNRVGPAHRGVLGRKAGLAPGSAYSAAVKSSKIVWTERTLNRWLTSPPSLLRGQKMGYSVGKLQDRLDLIAYLKTLQVNP